MRSSRRFISLGFSTIGLVLAAACGGQASDEPGASTEQASTSCAVTPDPTRSLFVTDATALAKFPLQAVMNQIVATGSTTGQTALELYDQLVDTLNTKAGGHTNGPHCDDHIINGVPTINGWPEQFCPRQEGTLATTNPFTQGSPDSYAPVGIVNRFDLAPRNGANCGEYRIVYGKLSGQTNFADRMLLIFEATLPNPDPAAGLAACLPVAEFWDNLTSDGSATDRASKLKSFYFTGLPGFVPVIRAANYGFGNTTNTGQIRANMFMNQVSGQEWELREFRLSQTCAGTACTLIANNTFVQNNPFGPLFGGTDPASQTFQRAFLNQVQHLAAKSVPNIGMNTANADDGPQSDEQFPTNQSYFQEAQANTTFLNNITAKLAAIGRSDLTAQNILDRATTQGCAGCHELSNNASLGAGLIWPSSNGFTQVTESSLLSPALTQVFLPARAKVLVNFINAHCASDGGAGGADAGLPQQTGDDTTTLGGVPVGSAN